MAIKVLGPLAVDGSGRLSPRDRVVLQALAVRQGRSVTSDELADAVWGDRPPASAHKNLQSCIVRLRKALGPGTIETTDQGYRLTLAADEVDARKFEAQVARARHLLAVGEADRVVFQLESALELWEGRAFADLGDWGPARREAGRLDEVRLDAEELLLDARLRCGQAGEVLAGAHEMVRAAPLRERRWELLALAQYRSGAQGESLRTIRQLRAVLARELGIDPSPDVAALEEAILRQDPTLLVPEARRAATRCPWQGLRAYGIDDAERFFGRDHDVRSCLALLTNGSFAALVGPSGSGKSSIMRAGVLAALRERGHRIVLITPGRRPLEALTALPVSADARTVLAVDQTEEVFALCEDLEERRDFLDRLTQEAARRQVILTLRGDRLSQVTEHTGFSRLVERGLHLVGSLDEDALRAAVTGPAQQTGLVLQPGLVDLLVREVRDDPGALPLLSHALLETWRRREGNTLTVDGYRSTGGIQGAVAQSAEQLYGSVDADDRHLLRDLILRMVSPGIDGEAVRTRVPRRLIASDAHHEHLVGMLVDARLVTSDEDVLEITHEALAGAWPRLRGWLDDDVEGQRIRHHLSGAADAWETLGRPDSELYRGVRLTRVLDWQSHTTSALTETERDFLAAAREASVAEERSAAERARAQARLIRRLRIVLGGAVVLLVLALAAGGVAVVQSERATRHAADARAAAETARQAAVSADARRVGARAQLTDDISLSLLLAAAGARLDGSPETQANLISALEKRPRLIRSVEPEGDYLETMAVSPDGRWIASSDDHGRMHLYDASSSTWLRRYDAGRTPDGEGSAMLGAFSRDSRQLAVILLNQESTEPVRLLDPDTMQPTMKLTVPGDKPVWGVDVEFSGDGRYLAATVQTVDHGRQNASAALGYAVVWDLRSPASPVRVPTGVDLQGVALSTDGRTLYTGNPLTAYDVADRSRIWRRNDLTPFITTFDVNAEGTLLALGDQSPERRAFLVDTATGETVLAMRGHRKPVWDIRFSPDGTLVGSVSVDGELIVWDAATGRPLERWETFDQWGVGFSPDNDLVHGGGGYSMLRTWDRASEDTYVQQTTRWSGTDEYTAAGLSPDGKRVAYRWVDGEGTGWVRFVDTATGEATAPTELPAQRLGWSLGAWHPDGRQYVGWCTDDALDAGPCPERGVVTILDPTTGEVVEKEKLFDKDIYAVAYVDQGRGLLVGNSDHRASVVDIDTGLAQGEAFDYGADNVVPIVDGSTAMVSEQQPGTGAEHWRMIDVSTGTVRSEWDVDVAATALATSPDGSTVAVGGYTGEIITVETMTGAERRRTTSFGVEVSSINYSDDGELLASSTADGGVSLWDADTLDQLGTVHPPHRGEPVPAGAQFIGDTHDVAIASYDGTVYRWETDLDRAIDFACQMAGRDLTEEEWAQYLPGQSYRPVCP